MARRVERGVTLIDTVVGSALMLVIFMGVAGAFQLAMDVVTNSKARAGAIALADERMEYIRSLSYASIGTLGGIPAGSIAQSESVTLNNVPYTRRTTIEYVDDSGDGLAGADSNGITVDYKAARVDVAWDSRQGTRHITLITRIEPPSGMEVACSSCGTLSISVVNASAQPLANAQVRIVNASTTPAIDVTTFTNSDGIVSLPGAPVASKYQITVSRTGYSSAQTYSSTSQNPNPSPGHLTVSNGQTTSATFAIDLLSTKNVYTWTQIHTGAWTDTLDDTSKISTSSLITVASGVAKLTGPEYPTSGEFQSTVIGPSALVQWKSLSWNGATSSATSILVRLYDAASKDLISESELPGNAAGFASTTISLLGVSTTTHPALLADFTLASSDTSATPSVSQYSVSYDYGPEMLPNIAFTMQGAKQIGSGPPIVYKYQQNLTTSAFGGLTIPNLEWDTYTISVASTTGYDIASACGLQPETLSPGTTVSTNLYLAAHTANSLLVDVKSAGVLIPGASVSVWKSGTATTTVSADACGQAFFGNLSGTTYWVQVTAAGHPAYINTSAVSGTTRFSVVLN